MGGQPRRGLLAEEGRRTSADATQPTVPATERTGRDADESAAKAKAQRRGCLLDDPERDFRTPERTVSQLQD